jgi:hypothetical protein
MGRDVDDLANRDPALAALMGATDSDFGSDEVNDYSNDYAGTTAGQDVEFSDTDYSGGDVGTEFGVDFGYPFGLEPEMSGVAFGAAAGGAVPVSNPAHPLYHPNPAAQAIIAKHLSANASRSGRQRLLEPNLNSDLKVERYTFAINATITALGTAQAIGPASNSPDVNFRPQRVTTNVPSPGFFMIAEGRVANVAFTVGGNIDAWQFNANAVGQHLDVPTLTPANKATVSGSYTGMVPSPLTGTGSYQLSVSFTGPATLAA